MSLRGRGPEGARPGSLAEIAAGRTRKVTSCLPEGMGMPTFENSLAAKKLDDLIARNAIAAEALRGTGGRNAHRKAERLARAAERQAARTDLIESYAAALEEIAESGLEPGG